MDVSNIHLVLNHLPVVGGVAALVLLASGLVLRNRAVSLAALALLVAVAIVAIPVFTSGRASDGTNLAAGVPEISERHESAAITSMIALDAAAAIAAAALFVWKTSHRFSMFAAVAVLVVGSLASVLLVHTALLGREMLVMQRSATASIAK